MTARTVALKVECPICDADEWYMQNSSLAICAGCSHQMAIKPGKPRKQADSSPGLFDEKESTDEQTN